jgi:meiotically up-regulated gene 157 (Mug157) protein
MPALKSGCRCYKPPGSTCILRDPYANAFYDDPNKVGEWKDDVTDMKPGLHERKWEIDSLCYPIRLSQILETYRRYKTF